MRHKTDYDAYWGVVYYEYVKDTKPWGCPSYKHVANLIYAVPPELIHEAAFCFNAFLNKRQVDKARNHADIIVCHDHVEPRIEQGSIDMFHNDDGSAQWNLRHFRPGGNNVRMPLYPGIFRHAIKTNPVITDNSDPTQFETGGRANVLWLDGHVTAIEETKGGFGRGGKDVPSRWYTAGGLWTSRFRN
jgi:prepilin-type processing-associated H-X9-DG protein